MSLENEQDDKEEEERQQQLKQQALRKSCQINRVLHEQLEDKLQQFLSASVVVHKMEKDKTGIKKKEKKEKKKNGKSKCILEQCLNTVQILIHLHSATSFVNIPRLNHVQIQFLFTKNEENWENGAANGNDLSVGGMQKLMNRIGDMWRCGFLRWVSSEHVCFVMNETVCYEFCGRIFKCKISVPTTATTTCNDNGNGGGEVKWKEGALFTIGSDHQNVKLDFIFGEKSEKDDNLKQQQVKGIVIERGIVPGYDTEVNQFCEYMFDGMLASSPLSSSAENDYAENGLTTTSRGGFRGVLLRGECGVGKSFFIRSILKHVKSQHPSLVSYRIVTHELIKSNVGGSERALRTIFMKALQKRQSTANVDNSSAAMTPVHIIVVEDLLDMQSGSRIEKLIGTELLYCMELASRQSRIRIGFVAVMSNSESVDSSFMRVDRLECDIELKSPSPTVRLQIFNALTHDRFAHDTAFLEKLSHETHGYVAADLKKLCSVGMSNIRSIQQHQQHQQHHEQQQEQDDNDADNLSRQKQVFFNVINTMKESLSVSSRFGAGIVPSSKSKNMNNVKFEDLAGIDDIIQKIYISVLHPLTHRHTYDQMGIRPPRGVLLRGPAGTGKTSLARAIANEAKANFVSVQCTDIISKVVGAPSRAISQLFQRARACSPCVLFFDQFEAIARARGNDSSESQSADQMLSTLLIEMDGVHSHSSSSQHQVLILAATNKPEMLDSAILRPGRFDQQIELRLPNHLERQQMVYRKLRDMPVRIEEYEKPLFESMINFDLNGVTPADLDNWCREAAMLCLRENIHNEHVKLAHFIKAKNYLFPTNVMEE